MDFSEVMAQIRQRLTGAASSLSFLWKTRKMLIIGIFLLLSIGVVVWARFGFSVEISQFFAKDLCDIDSGDDLGCEADGLAQCKKKECRQVADGVHRCQVIGDVPNCSTTVPAGQPGGPPVVAQGSRCTNPQFPIEAAENKCMNSAGQISDHPIQWPGCLVWEIDGAKYDKYRECASEIDDDKKVTDCLPDPRFMEIEGRVVYNNCPFGVFHMNVIGGSDREGNDFTERDAVLLVSRNQAEKNVDNAFLFDPEPSRTEQLRGDTATRNGSHDGAFLKYSPPIPTCALGLREVNQYNPACRDSYFRVSFDAATYNCGRVGFLSYWRLQPGAGEGNPLFGWTNPVGGNAEGEFTPADNTFAGILPIGGLSGVFDAVFNYGKDCESSDRAPGTAPRVPRPGEPGSTAPTTTGGTTTAPTTTGGTTTAPTTTGGTGGGPNTTSSGGSCPDHSGAVEAAELTVECGENSNTLTWQSPSSLNARVNSVLRSENGEDNEFVFAEGGCFDDFVISTFTDGDVSPGNTYAYSVKTDANTASNRVECPQESTSPTPTTVVATPTPAPVCGDSVCNGSESCSSCADDCGTCGSACGDGICTSNETSASCTVDCGAPSATCGNGVCDGNESCSNCAHDCGTCGATCGDGVCDKSESCSSCANDCGTCGAPRAAGPAPIRPAGQTPTGPAEATLLAFILSGLTALLYVSYTHTGLFRRRELGALEQQQDPMDFRS